jgi:MYXO-CTERM domain-containing protein
MVPLFLMAMTAFAVPVEGGIQVAIFEEGADFIRGFIEGQEFDIAVDEIGTDYSCFDMLGVRNFNLNIPINEFELSFDDRNASIRVTFDTIRGEDMELFGEDEDWWDICPSFSTDFYYLQITDLVFEVGLSPSVQDGNLVMEVVGNPLVSGNLDTDINNVPDSLILAAIEGLIWDTIADKAAELIPSLVASYWDKDMLSGNVFDFDLAAILDDAQVTGQSLQLGATLHASWTGDSGCSPAGAASGHGRRPDLTFGDGNGADLGIGITESQLNRLFRDAWADGFLCFPQDRMDLVYDAISGLIDPDIGGLALSAVFRSAPVITIEDGRATASFPNLELEIRGEVDGSEIEILGLVADLHANLELGLEPALTALTLTLHDLDLDFDEFRAEHLLSDNEEAVDHFKSFLRGWVADWVAEQIQGMALFATQFHFMGTYIRVDDIAYETGGMKILIKLYDENDPEVDKIAPDTEVTLVYTDPATETASLELSGTDDRTAPLAWTIQVDGEGWSSWQLEDTALIEGLSMGSHTIEVMARDNWLNVDATPASIVIEMGDPFGAVEDEGDAKGCGCSSRPGSAGGLAGLLLVGLGLVRRRR